MSIGTDLLQEWLNLRSNARKHKKYWDEQRRNQRIANMITAQTSREVPYHLLSAKQKREVKRINAEGMHVPPAHKNTPALYAMNQVLGGHLLNTTASDLQDMSIVGEVVDIAATVAENPTLYYWGTDPMRAALEASTSLPPESSIIADLYSELPRRGLWLFETPMALPTTSQDTHVAGLLWDLSAKGLWMTTLIRVHPGTATRHLGNGLNAIGDLTGTWAGWYPAEVSLQDLEQRSRQMYRETYEGTAYEHSTDGQIMGEDAHINICMQMSKFWLAATEWMKQRILVRSRPQRVLPKNKKRARKMTEQVKGQMPTIEIVQLRRTESGPSEGTGSERHYTMRFIVHGHFRNQYYPSKGVYSPKWIASYVKGPKDAPLKETIRGFAVTR